VGAAFGVEGWLKVNSFTEPPQNLLNYPHWLLRRGGHWSEVTITQTRVTGQGILAKFAQAPTRETARTLTGSDIGVPRSELPSTVAGEYYWEDLLGLEVYSPTGQRLGRVDHFLHSPAHPLIAVHGERKHLVPLVRGRILAVDLQHGRMTLDWDVDW